MTPVTSALFVSRYFWPEPIGSAPFSTDLAVWLSDHGVQTTVLCGLPHYPGAEVFPSHRNGDRMDELVGRSVVKRVAVGAPASDSAAARIGNELAFLVKGLLAMAQGRVRRHGLVLALCPSILSVALALAARRRDGLCVAVVHDIQSGLAQSLGFTRGRWIGAAMHAVERALLNRSDLVIVLSDEMKRQLIANGVESAIEVVPLWVDVERIRMMPPVVQPTVKLLYSGNFGRKQGLTQLVDLAQHLASVRPAIRIVLRGRGSQAAAIAGEVRRRGLDNVSLDDLQATDDLADALSAGDIHLVPQSPGVAAFCLPSKIFNIMAVGRPFVATAVPGSALWQLQRESGAFLCVPPNSLEEMAGAVIRLADDAAFRVQLGYRGRAFVERNYAKPVVLGRFMRHLDALSALR